MTDDNEMKTNNALLLKQSSGPKLIHISNSFRVLVKVIYTLIIIIC